MRILVADVAIEKGALIEPVAQFLGLGWRRVSPVPQTLKWRGHDVIIRPGISIKDAEALKPDFVMGLMSYYGIGRDRAAFYEHFFAKNVPVFTWGNDSEIPRLMVKVVSGNPVSKRIVFAKPNHPLLQGLKPEDIKTSGDDWRTLVKAVKGDIGLAYDPDNGSWEIIYLEEHFGTRRWLHYHPWPPPPDKLVDNMLAYMTRPSRLPAVAGAGGATLAGLALWLATRNPVYSLVAAAAGGVAGAAIGKRRARPRY